MNDYKIEDFHRDHSGQPFPSFQKVELLEGLKFCAIYAKEVGLPKDTDPLIVLKHIAERATFIGHLNLQDFDLATLLRAQSIDISFNQSVYVDWRHFDDIDQMLLSDMSQFFFDIWYGEDISLFDSTLSWMMFIFHYKAITFVKFKKDHITATTAIA